MVDERRPGGPPSGEQIAGGFFAGHDKAWKMLGERMLRGGSKAVRIVAKRVPGAPGLVYDIANFAHAEDKPRALAGIVGGSLGAVAGGALGAAAGGINAPIGAAVGSTFGERIGEDLYDAHADEIRQKLEATKRWMAERQAELARAPRRAASALDHAFDGGLPPYHAPMR
ncbi:MAG: hypothetical protein ABI655_06025 [Phenylobacterium sp.]